MRVVFLLLILNVVTGLMGLDCMGDVPRRDSERPKPIPVKPELHDGYFVSNKFEPDAPASFLAIRDQAKFDQVFGVAFVMGDKSNRLKPGAFQTKMVVSVIKRGNAVCTFKVTEVTVHGDTLRLSYTAKFDKPGSATFSCPLIVTVPKGAYQKVMFIENGKAVRTLTREEEETRTR